MWILFCFKMLEWGFSTLSCRCENAEFELVLVKSSRPTSSSVSSKKSNFSIFWQIFTHFPVNFGIKIIAITFPFFWYYLPYYLSNISLPNWSLNFILVQNSSLVYGYKVVFYRVLQLTFSLSQILIKNAFSETILIWCLSKLILLP